VLSLSLSAWSADKKGTDKNPPREGHHDLLTPEQRDFYATGTENYQNKIYPLKEDLRDLHYLYSALTKTDNINIEEIKKVISDMRGVRDKLRAEQIAFQDELKKKGLPPFLGHGDDDRADDLGAGNCFSDRRARYELGFHGKQHGPNN
jgi:hypothetical protein